MDKELAAGLRPESSGQKLNVWMEIGDKWRPTGVSAGTDTLLRSSSVTLTVGSSAPSASLLMTPNCGVPLTHQRDEMLSSGTLTGLSSGPR